MKTSRTIFSRFIHPQNFFEYVFLFGMIAFGLLNFIVTLLLQVVWPNQAWHPGYLDILQNCAGIGIILGLIMWLLLCVLPARFAKSYPDAEQNEDEIKK